MKQDALNNLKVTAFDWLSKLLLGIVLWLVKDMHGDLKFIMQTIPVHEVRIGNLESNRLIDRFKAIRIPMKNEEVITYDSLMQK